MGRALNMSGEIEPQPGDAPHQVEQTRKRALLVGLGLLIAVWALTAAADAFLVKELALALFTVPALTLAAAAALWWGRTGAEPLLALLVHPARKHPAAAIALVAGLSVPLLLLLARGALDAFPTSSDEYAYILQAKSYAQGRLWADPPPLHESFRQLRVVVKEGIWISAYQPGWPALLSLFERIGAPLWIVNPLVGGANLLAFFALARTRLRVEFAFLATLALLSSSFFLLNLASYFAHGFAALAAILFVLCGRRFLAGLDLRWALAAGACLGLLGVTRTFNAAVFAIPFVYALLIRPERWKGAVAFGIGGLPFLAILLSYNAAVTGSPFIPVQSWVQGEPLGAPGTASSLFSVSRIVRLYLWTSPMLLVGAALAFVFLWRRKALDFADWMMPATIFAFVFYGGDGAVQYGPRYLFEAWPFLILTAAAGLQAALSAKASPRIAALAASAALMHLFFQVGYAAPRIDREHRIALDRQDIYKTAQAEGLSNAVVFVAGPSGTIRPIEKQDLSRNGLVIGDERVTYAWDRGVDNSRVLQLLPGRSAYVWRNGELALLSAGRPSAAPQIPLAEGEGR